jgi:DNA adenine methylase
VKPLFMWAGGKNKMLKHYRPLMPKTIDAYCEPFFGGGAMFIEVMNNYDPKECFINDIEAPVANIYSEIRDNYQGFIAILNDLESQYMPKSKEDRKKFYYDVRQQHAYDYETWGQTKESATLYFLMKTGFNGIYQINKNTNGRYGTPSGLLNQKHGVYDREVLSWWHTNLQGVSITSDDWRECVASAPSNAFFFLDPPYRTSFADYNSSFNDDDLLDLISFADKSSNVFLSNRDDDGWFDNNKLSLNTKHFPVTYTAGRRKKVDGVHEAKKATEILLYK